MARKSSPHPRPSGVAARRNRSLLAMRSRPAEIAVAWRVATDGLMKLRDIAHGRAGDREHLQHFGDRVRPGDYPHCNARSPRRGSRVFDARLGEIVRYELPQSAP